MLARDPAWLQQDLQETDCMWMLSYQWTGCYAAVPANGPAANESQPHPLPGLRYSAAHRGPNGKSAWLSFEL